MLDRFYNWWNARIVIPSTFSDCLTYGQRQDFMWKKIKELEEKIDDIENKDEENS